MNEFDIEEKKAWLEAQADRLKDNPLSSVYLKVTDLLALID